MKQHQTHTAILILAGLFSLQASAFYPVDGWWMNLDEPGRGIQMEMQDDELFISIFHYGDDGQPLWWVSSGRFDQETWTMSSMFLQLENGPCPACPYTGFPDIVEGAETPVTIEFTSPVTAILHWAGGATPIERQYWRYSWDQPNLFLYGEFHFTTGALGLYFGDRIVFDGNTTNDDGVEYVTGRIRDGGTSRLAVGRFSEELNQFIFLLDASTNYYKFFSFAMTKDRMEGRAWTYPKGGDVSGSGLPFIGHRVASRSFVQTGVGPHSIQSLNAPMTKSSRDDQNAQQHQLQLMVNDVSTMASDQRITVQAASKLQTMLESPGSLK